MRRPLILPWIVPILLILLWQCASWTGLLRDQVWAQWIARIAGIPALLFYGSMALRGALSVGVEPNAVPLCLLGVGWFLYWAFLEYLIWAVSD